TRVAGAPSGPGHVRFPYCPAALHTSLRPINDWESDFVTPERLPVRPADRQLVPGLRYHLRHPARCSGIAQILARNPGGRRRAGNAHLFSPPTLAGKPPVWPAPCTILPATT